MYIVRHNHKDKQIGKQLWLIFLSVCMALPWPDDVALEAFEVFNVARDQTHPPEP